MKVNESGCKGKIIQMMSKKIENESRKIRKNNNNKSAIKESITI